MYAKQHGRGGKMFRTQYLQDSTIPDRKARKEWAVTLAEQLNRSRLVISPNALEQSGETIEQRGETNE